MAKVHFLNVNQGDCIILEHNSGRVTMFDISAGNIESLSRSERALVKSISPASGNFQMCQNPTNPLDYLDNSGIERIFRFILSHPDMDHLDGFSALMDKISVNNFWHTGAEKKKPDFSNYGGFKEEDWDRYTKVRDGKEDGTSSVKRLSGGKFSYANEDDDGGPGDALSILSPNQSLVDDGNKTQDFNDASYVMLYRSAMGKVLLSGDAHDKTWEHVLENYSESVANVDLLIAPHHGRKSGRSYEFLDTVKPKLTLFGCAPSEHLAYDAWNYRNLAHVTNNQCGCVVAEEGQNSEMEIYVENENFASKSGGNTSRTNDQGFYLFGTV